MDVILFSLFVMVVQFGVWIFFIYMIVKAVKQNRNRYNNNNNNASNTAPSGRRQNASNTQKHEHSYEHKVEPLGEATVMQQHYERQAEQAKKRAEREAMYNEGTGRDTSASRNKGYTTGTVGKNGDYGDMPKDNERLVICRYCAAKNIVPKYSAGAYNCYFCRQPVE